MCEGFIRRVMCVNQQRMRPISIQYMSPHKLTNRCVLPEMNINKKQINREMATFAIKVPMLYDFNSRKVAFETCSAGTYNQLYHFQAVKKS